MRRRSFLPSLLPLAAGLAGVSTVDAFAQQPLDVSGIKFPPTVQVGNSTLVLNGAGTRYRFVVKVYAAGLYVATKAATTDALLAAAGAKRMHVVMLREIDANDLGKLFTRGMQDNSPREEFAKSIPGTLRLAEMFAAKKRMAANENFTVDWVPGQGTVISVNGRVQGEPIREPEFFNALMRIWLGNSPADATLKDALLGLPPRAPAGNTQ